VTRNIDRQNELRQFAVLRCYDYSDTVKRLHIEGNLTRWLSTVIWHENLRLIDENNSIDSTGLCDIEDTVYSDRLEDLKKLLTPSERAWINAYIKDGTYKNIQRRTTIDAAYISIRIKAIIEKCKQLKSTLQ